jgi:hypothetical protein
MSINLIRVINQQTTHRSILLDKLDDGQANTEGYAHKNVKQKVYVPFANPLNPAVRGYTDLVLTDRVLLSSDVGGTISGLVAAGRVLAFAFSSALKATPTISSVAHVAGETTITGTTYLSVVPDITYVVFRTPGGVTQKVPSAAFAFFNATQIRVQDAAVTIGVPTEGWTVTVEANCALSNVHPIGNVATITTAILEVNGDVTISGANFTSTPPLTSSVEVIGLGPVPPLTQAAILAGGGVFTDVSIVIPAAMIAGAAETTTMVQIVAEGFTSVATALIMTPVLTSAQKDVPMAGDLTITGSSFLSTAPEVSSVVITGTGAITLTSAEIIGGGGTFLDASIVIPAALFTNGPIAAATSSAQVLADGLSSAVVAVIP